MSDARSILAERVAALPAAIATAARAPIGDDPAAWAALCARVRRYVVTGGGLSEGPARVLVALLRRRGLDARFVSQSVFAAAPLESRLDVGDDTGLILFSQGLAPNARLPLPYLGPGLLERRPSAPDGAVVFAGGLLVTAVTPAAAPGDPSSAETTALARRLRGAGHVVWTLPPPREDGLLLRVIGPAVALVAATRLADALARDTLAMNAEDASRLEARVADAIAAPGQDLFGERRVPIAIVAEPELAELAMPLRWKLLEGLRVPDPPVWDPLQVAHGPLQSFFDERTTLLCLRTRSSRYDGLYARLRRVLAKDGRQRLVELRSGGSDGDGADLVELDALLDACLLATLERHPLALETWPSKGEDGPIYDVDPLVLAGERKPR